MRRLLHQAGGDFDRQVASWLSRTGQSTDSFEEFAAAGRALDDYFIARVFPSVTTHSASQVTPFHDFALYAKHMAPVVFNGFFRSGRSDPRPYLARCEGVKAGNLDYSIVISEGNVDLRSCSRSFIICGADVTISSLDTSIVVASGHIRIGAKGSGANHTFLVAGEQLTVGGRARMSLLVTPRKITVPTGSELPFPTLVLDGRRQPAPGLYTFRDLWADHGLEAVDDGATVRIAKIRPESQIGKVFAVGDRVLQCNTRKIESIGQFRRLLQQSRDSGHLEVDVERAGVMKTIRIRL